MTKEHAYAYEAGYRDGSIHYELEHCPACANVADLQEALEENAKLREEQREYQATIDSLVDECTDHKDENAKLRELAKQMHICLTRPKVYDGKQPYLTATECPYFTEGACDYNACGFERRMRELGIE